MCVCVCVCVCVCCVCVHHSHMITLRRASASCHDRQASSLPLVKLSLPLLSCRFHVLLFFFGEIACPGEIGSPIDISLKVGANSAQAELTQSRMSRYDFCASRTPLLFTTPTYRPLKWLGVIMFVAILHKTLDIVITAALFQEIQF